MFGFDLALQAVLEQASQRNSLHVVRAITDDAAIDVELDFRQICLSAQFYFPEATPSTTLRGPDRG